ncbi:hypothetical protein ACA910_003025 [Epithemia clementina (nom. ined.)]
MSKLKKETKNLMGRSSRRAKKGDKAQLEKAGAATRGHGRIRALSERLMRAPKCVCCNKSRRSCQCHVVSDEDDWKAWAVAAAMADGEAAAAAQTESRKGTAEFARGVGNEDGLKSDATTVPMPSAASTTNEQHRYVAQLRLCCGKHCQGGKKCCDRKLKQQYKRSKSVMSVRQFLKKEREEEEEAEEGQDQPTVRLRLRLRRQQQKPNHCNANMTASAVTLFNMTNYHDPVSIEHVVLQLQQGVGSSLGDYFPNGCEAVQQPIDWDVSDFYDRPNNTPLQAYYYVREERDQAGDASNKCS